MPGFPDSAKGGAESRFWPPKRHSAWDASRSSPGASEGVKRGGNRSNAPPSTSQIALRRFRARGNQNHRKRDAFFTRQQARIQPQKDNSENTEIEAFCEKLIENRDAGAESARRRAQTSGKSCGKRPTNLQGAFVKGFIKK